jgi:glycine/D-amino acid oxidase-like deaminating enzyme
MARIIFIGGGIVGLTAAHLLGADGHDVTVLERDAAPPADPETAWESWDRKGVNQFRMLHFFQPRFCELMTEAAPEIIDAMRAAGALEMNPFSRPAGRSHRRRAGRRRAFRHGDHAPAGCRSCDRVRRRDQCERRDPARRSGGGVSY